MTTTETRYTVTATEAAAYLTDCIQANVPAILWGEPGVGKSSIQRQVADELGLVEINFRASLMEPVDVNGMPTVGPDGRLHFVPSGMLFPTDGRRYLLHLDELNRASIQVQNALLQAVLDRRIGENVLPDGMVITASCNYETNGGGIQRMPSALSNRFTHLDLVPDMQAWSEWAVTAGIEPVVLAFIRFRPDALHHYDPKARVFPSARGWETVSKIVARKVSPAGELMLITGTVGRGEAIEFAAYQDIYRTMPNPDAIIMDPLNAPKPQDSNAAVLCAVSAALAARANDQNVGAIIQYLDRLPREYAAFCIQSAVRRTADPQTHISPLTHTSAYTKWAVANAGLIG